MGPREKWKTRAEALWSSESFDCGEAAKLLIEIVSGAETPRLIEVAREALPTLRAAAAPTAQTSWRDIARRQFGAVRHELNQKNTTPFGKRGGADSGVPGELCAQRRLLGLPPDEPLSDPLIRQAYRRAAMSVHPDAGGDKMRFLDLVAARDALLAEL